jgi:hypothetical protein
MKGVVKGAFVFILGPVGKWEIEWKSSILEKPLNDNKRKNDKWRPGEGRTEECD